MLYFIIRYRTLRSGFIGRLNLYSSAFNSNESKIAVIPLSILILGYIATVSAMERNLLDLIGPNSLVF